MYQERIVLTSKDILEKDFKIDTRGYRPQEVDRYLDTIIKDYEEMNSIINELDSELEIALENEGQGASGVNADLLRRLSNLEKIIYGKE